MEELEKQQEEDSAMSVIFHVTENARRMKWNLNSKSKVKAAP